MISNSKNSGESSKTRDFRKSIEVYTPFKSSRQQKFTENFKVLVQNFEEPEQSQRLLFPEDERASKLTQESFRTSKAVKGSNSEYKGFTQPGFNIPNSFPSQSKKMFKRDSISEKGEEEKPFYIEPDLLAYTNPIIHEKSEKLEEDLIEK